MENSSDGAASASPEHSEFAWKGAHLLGRIHALNERCLELLSQLARSDRQRINLAILDQHRSLYRSLTPAARKRAANTPFLLLDIRFNDADWWRSARDPRASRRRPIGLQPAFTGKVSAELMRETLTLAWSAVTFERGGASLLFGMTAPVCSIIAELVPQDIERIASRYSAHLQPRWDDFPAYWGRLLRAARDADDEALHDLHLHGVQLIGSDLISVLDGRFI
jgi:hypothetical protein